MVIVGIEPKEDGSSSGQGLGSCHRGVGVNNARPLARLERDVSDGNGDGDVVATAIMVMTPPDYPMTLVTFARVPVAGETKLEGSG